MSENQTSDPVPTLDDLELQLDIGFDLLAANYKCIGINRNQALEIAIYFGLSIEEAEARIKK